MQNIETQARLKQWAELKLGMFIHWGVYSALGGVWNGESMDYIGEWIMSKYRIPLDTYKQLAKNFNPKSFSAKSIVELAKNAGFKYIIFTAKHHDGFAMYKSFHKYNICDFSSFKRDPLEELAQECRKNDIKLCIYYSQSLDWSDENGGGTDENFPQNFGMSWCNDWDFPDNKMKNFDKYFNEKAIPQIAELLTNYGDIYSFWFDCPLTISHKQCSEIYNLVKKIQPACLINGRLGSGLGDFDSLGDNYIPHKASDNYKEAIITVNDTWGYKSFDNNWKTSNEMIDTLVRTLSKGANLVINIGPDGCGNVPVQCKRSLIEFGNWIKSNSECVYGSSCSPFKNDFSWGSAISKNNILYLVNLRDTKIGFAGVENSMKQCGVLGQKQSINYKQYIVNDIVFFEAECLLNQVVKVTYESKVNVCKCIIQAPNKQITLDAQYAKIHSEQQNFFSKMSTIAKTDATVNDLSVMKIGDSGLIENWFNKSDSIEFNFKCLYFGRYQVEVTTAALYHSRKWTGGHQVKVECQGQYIENTLKCDTVVDNGYYQLVKSNVGTITLDNESITTLILSASYIVDDGVGIAIKNIVLVKVGD